MDQIRSRLREVQATYELTHGRLAVRLSSISERDWHRETVRRIQIGYTRRVPADYVRDFCLALDVNPTWLLFGNGHPRWSDAVNEPRKLRLLRSQLAKTVAWIDALEDKRG